MSDEGLIVYVWDYAGAVAWSPMPDHLSFRSVRHKILTPIGYHLVSHPVMGLVLGDPWGDFRSADEVLKFARFGFHGFSMMET